jgi:hypothetical protein
MLTYIYLLHIIALFLAKINQSQALPTEAQSTGPKAQEATIDPVKPKYVNTEIFPASDDEEDNHIALDQSNQRSHKPSLEIQEFGSRSYHTPKASQADLSFQDILNLDIPFESRYYIYDGNLFALFSHLNILRREMLDARRKARGIWKHYQDLTWSSLRNSKARKERGPLALKLTQEASAAHSKAGEFRRETNRMTRALEDLRSALFKEMRILFQERQRAAQKQRGLRDMFTFESRVWKKPDYPDYSEEVKRQEKRRFIDHALSVTQYRLESQEGDMMRLQEPLADIIELVRKSESVFLEEVKKKEAPKKSTLNRLEAPESSGLFNEARPSLKHLVKLHLPL